VGGEIEFDWDAENLRQLKRLDQRTLKARMVSIRLPEAE
jgi:hypothetical protein